jgi:hypothetical protein
MPIHSIPAKFDAALWCRSRNLQMPRMYLCVLPSRSRPSLFGGD